MKKFSFALLFLTNFVLTSDAQDNWSQSLADPFLSQHDTLDYKLRISPFNVMIHGSSSYIVKEITDPLDTVRQLNWSKLLTKTKDKNGAFGQFSFSLLSTEFYYKNLVFNVGFSNRSEGYTSFDGPGVKFVIGGNAGLDAKSEIAPDIHYNSWYQLNVGAKKYFNSSFLGLNLKLVDGIEHFLFDGSYEVTADDIFNEIRIQRNVILQSTSLVRYNNLEDIDFQPNKPFTDDISFANIGLLFDLYGGTKVGQHVFNLAITDIGFINWNQGARTNEYESKGEVTYTGIDLSEALSNEFEFNLQDSLENIIGLQKTDTKSYRSNLLTKINARYQYNLTDDFSLGINNFFALDGTYGYFQVSMFANKSFADWIDLGLVYSFDRYTAANIGASAHINFKNIRLGLSTQNIISIFDPYGYKMSNIHIATQVKF